VSVVLVDYGAGNLPSVEGALRRLGVPSRRCSTPEPLADADAVILPGVGHFSPFAAALDRRGLRQPLLDAIAREVPFLGICLGLQALWEGSEEAPMARGLGVLPGRIAALPAGVKLPHMGWNRLRRLSGRTSRLLEGVAPDAYVYFAHSFAGSADGAVAVCDYGTTFTAVFERGALFGVQFHPEKSGAVGSVVLRNFLETAR
jgi:glutamine amidotransferase